MRSPCRDRSGHVWYALVGPFLGHLGTSQAYSILEKLFPAQAAALAIPRVTLGSLSVSPIGVGTWAWGNQFLWGYKKKQDDPRLQEAFNHVLNKGINFFDSGDSYGTGALEGQAERLLGKFIEEYDYHRDDIKAQADVHIATKIAPYPFRIGSESFKQAMRQSMRRVRRNYIDIGQLHWPPPLGWQEKTYWQGLAELYSAKEIKAIGLSNYGPLKLREAAEFFEDAGAKLVSNQVQFSLVSSVPLQSGVLAAAQEVGIRTIAYSPLGLGLLTGRYSESRLPEGPRRLLFREILPQIKPILQTMEDVAEARSRLRKISFSEIALNWPRAKGCIPIVGIKNLKQAEEATRALEWQLSPPEIEALDKAAAKLKRQTLQNIFQSR